MENEVLLTFAVIGGILTVFGFIAATWKLFRFIFRVDRALPTLLNIAHQFESNGGSSLKDKIDKISDRAEEVAAENRIAVRIAEDSRTVAKTNAAIVNELTHTQTEELMHIKEYLHDKMHEVMNALSKTTLQAGLTEKRSVRIEERLDKLLPLVVRTRESFPDHSDNESESAANDDN